jgi:hypothetical protein
MKRAYFFDMIRHLRENEGILLFGNVLLIPAEEEAQCSEYLREAYLSESLGYPRTPPSYNADAGMWAAKTVYTAAQLILYREEKAEKLAGFFAEYSGKLDVSAILSADLCLRFVPNMLTQLKLIDPEDPLNGILENLLYQWHYSGVLSPLDVSRLDFSVYEKDACLLQMYVNRVTGYKKVKLAALPALREHVAADLGIFAEELWKDFKTETTIYEQHRQTE